MTALDFPASPTVGQKYPSPAVTGVPVYSWDGEKWTTLGGAIGSTGGSDVIPAEVAGTGAAGSSTLWSRGDHAHPATAPTPPIGDNDTSIATTAFVTAAVVNSTGSIPTTYVRYDQPQTLTAPQLIQARQNIYAAPFDAMAYSGLQINGGMEVSQERGGAGIQNAAGYICDGWRIGFGGSMGFNALADGSGGNLFYTPYRLLVTTSTAQASLGANDYIQIQQWIEGWRCARLQWGTINAQPLTIAFWTAHHRTGVYSVSVHNSADGRSYSATYTQNVADIAQYNVITIPGDTLGTWLIDNTVGLKVLFSLGCGSSLIAPSPNTWLSGNYLAAPGQINGVAATSDTFRITGVTVLPGSEAPSAARSPFVMRSYDQELGTCRRYYRRIGGTVVADVRIGGYATTANGIAFSFPLEPVMRAAPTATTFGTFTNTNNAGSSLLPSASAFSWQITAIATGMLESYGNLGGFSLDARL